MTEDKIINIVCFIVWIIVIRIGAYFSTNCRPKLNDRVTFDLSEGNQGRMNATSVYIEGVHVPITVLIENALFRVNEDVPLIWE